MDKAASKTSFFCSEREYGHSLLKSDDCVSEIRVETLTLAAILRMAEFPRVDLLKMDIEGAEKIVMPAIDSCGAAIRHLIAELHPPYDLDNFADDCRKINLEVENFNGDMAFAACANNAGSNVKLAGGKNDPLVSIIMRSFNEARALRETLPTLAAQEYKNWELIVIDSGSTDGSVELIRSAQPRHFIQISPHEYNPARVMNHGMQLARSDFGIFLNADATPQNNNWLRPLVEALIDPQAAAVFGKQIPRPDCHAVFAHDYERCFGANRKSAGWEHFFSMASSGIRKDIWSKRGFNERLQYSEDDEYTRWCRAQNYKIIYAPESVAMHSHNYTPEQACKRSFGEARALAAVWPGARTDFNFARTLLLGWLNDARRDFFFCARKNRLGEWPHALQIRWRQRRARLAGFADGWKNYRENGTVKHVNPPLCAGQNPAV